ERADRDWRNNTWREDRFDEDYRNNDWRTKRGLDDWRQRDDYAKKRNPDNPIDRGNVECGKGPGSSSACSNYARDVLPNRSEKTDEDENKDVRQKPPPVTRGVENCGREGAFRRC